MSESGSTFLFVLMMPAMPLPALVLRSLLVQQTAFAPSCSCALVPVHQNSYHLVRPSSALSFSNHDNDGESVFSPDMLQLQVDQSTEREVRRIPRRAMPHVKNASPAEAAKRAGYIIRRRDTMQQQPRISNSQRLPPEERGQTQPSRSSLDLDGRNTRKSKPSVSRNSLLEELSDEPEQRKDLLRNKEERKGARRVTFKATREASKEMVSNPAVTLTEYMTQPPNQYSLLSFHDAEGSDIVNDGSNNNFNQTRARRWLVRRLTTTEAQRYINCSTSSKEDGAMDESNLFRLAVPLSSFGWDLTPVIDLEVIPPEYNTDDSVESLSEETPPKWAPFRGIRKRIHHGEDTICNTKDHSPTVKIRSLRVSLLSTQEEASELMSTNNNRRGTAMQKEAIEMAGKVEEWLRPHIYFATEITWEEHCSKSRNDVETASPSTVTVKSTAITSLTIPKIPSGFLRATMPSAFGVKLLGATLTSRALAICLPRFLRQLEKDYIRWSGSGRSKEGSD